MFRVFLLLFLTSLSFAKPHYRNITVDTLLLTCDTVTSATYVLVKSPDDTIRCMHVDSISGSGGGFVGTIEDLHVPYYVAAYDSFTTSPISIHGTDVAINNSSPYGKLDIASGGRSLVIGGNYFDTLRTDNTSKYSSISSVHRLNAEEPFAVIYNYSSSTQNHLRIGGGIADLNAATNITFYTGADNTTTAGSQRMTITPEGHVGIGASSPDSTVDINGSFRIIGNSYFGGRVGMGEASPGSILDVAGTADIDTLKLPCGVTTEPTYVLCKTTAAGDTIRQIDIDELKNTILSGGIDFNGTIEDLHVPYYVETYDSFTSAPIIIYNGNVGVNDETPDSMLDVDGSFRVTGNSTFGGRVGIGTNTPAENLHIDGSSPSMLVSNTGDNSASIVAASNSQGGYFASYDASDNLDLFLSSYGSSYFTGGSVGIGTNFPDSTLTVDGSIHTNHGFFEGKLGVGYSPDSTLTINGSGSFSGHVRINGYLGLGTNTPEEVFHIHNGNILLDNNYEIMQKDYSGTKRTILCLTYADKLNVGTDVGPLSLMAGSGSYVERMRITTDGKVGINDLTPDSMFSVIGSSYMSGNARFGTNVGIRINNPEASLDVCYGGLSLLVGADNGSSSRTNTADKYSRIAFPHYLNSEEKAMFLYGLSTSSENRVHIGGGSTTCNAATLLRFYTAANNTTIQGSERMRINSDGNVGIGETSPDSLLTVDGGCQIKDNALINGKLKLSSLNNSDGRITYIDTDSSINTSYMLYDESFGHLSLPGNVYFPLYQADYSKGFILNTNNGNDTGMIYISSCGALGWRRGSGIEFYGSDYDDLNLAGRVSIKSAQSSSHSGPASEIMLRQGEIIFYLDTLHSAPYLDITATGTNVSVTAASTMQIGVTGNTDILQVYSNGITTGSPSGGAMGDGTINAKGLYDDGSLVSGYPLDYKYNKNFNIEKWDSLAGGNHEPARNFIRNRKRSLDIDSFCKHIKEERTLPALDESEKTGKKLSTGESIQKLTETIEVMAIHIIELNKRIKNLEKE